MSATDLLVLIVIVTGLVIATGLLAKAYPMKHRMPLARIPDARTRAAADPVVEANRRMLLERSEVGVAKYGVMLDRTDLSLRDWLQHALEETLDHANYLQAAIHKIDRESKEKGIE